jgi:hypothetical protein
VVDVGRLHLLQLSEKLHTPYVTSRPQPRNLLSKARWTRRSVSPCLTNRRAVLRRSNA